MEVGLGTGMTAAGAVLLAYGKLDREKGEKGIAQATSFGYNNVLGALALHKGDAPVELANGDVVSM